MFSQTLLCWVEIQVGLLLKRKMGPKKGRRMRKIEIPTDTPTEFELGDRAADIQRREKRHRNRGRKPAGRNYTLSTGGNDRKVCKDRPK